MSREKKKLKAFNEVNKDDKYFIDMNGFQNYKNFVSPLHLMATERLIKLTCKALREDEEREGMDICKSVLNDVFESYPKVLPRIKDIESLSYEECEIILMRFSAYYL